MKTLLENSPLIPVIVIHSIEDAIPTAQKLIDQGITTLEITLRTEAAFDAIKLIKQTFPDCTVAAGTVVNEAQLIECKHIGCDFVVSPGCFVPLLKKAKEIGLPLLPGVMTPSNIITALNHGYDILKLFPANLAGGLSALKAYASVFPNVLFCPTGGVNEKNYQEFLNLNNVICVGGSWLTS